MTYDKIRVTFTNKYNLKELYENKDHIIGKVVYDENRTPIMIEDVYKNIFRSIVVKYKTIYGKTYSKYFTNEKLFMRGLTECDTGEYVLLEHTPKDIEYNLISKSVSSLCGFFIKNDSNDKLIINIESIHKSIVSDEIYYIENMFGETYSRFIDSGKFYFLLNYGENNE